MTTPLNELAEYFGPHGKGSMKPYHAQERSGDHTIFTDGVVLDTEYPMFRALWMEQEGIWSHRDCREALGICQNILADGNPVPGTQDCKGAGYVRRSRAEVALMLPDAIKQAGYHFAITSTNTGYNVWAAKPSQPLYDAFFNLDCYDALATAVLMAEKAGRTAG